MHPNGKVPQHKQHGKKQNRTQPGGKSHPFDLLGESLDSLQTDVMWLENSCASILRWRLRAVTKVATLATGFNGELRQ
jgi:hypothetical protein